MISKLEVLKQVLEHKISSILGDEEVYKIHTFYKTINSNDDIDRYEEDFYKSIDKINDTQYGAMGILTQTNDGNISYLGTGVSYNFSFSLSMITLLENEDKLKDVFSQIIEDLTTNKQSVEINGVKYIMQVGISNPNFDLPNIENDDEILTLEINGECLITSMNVITDIDLIKEVYFKIGEDGTEYKMPVVDAGGVYSAEQDGNIQTRQTGYYTQSWTYKCGIQDIYTIICDLDNPVCKELFKMTKLRVENPNIDIYVREIICGDEYIQKKFVYRIDTNTNEDGIIQLSVTMVNNN